MKKVKVCELYEAIISIEQYCYLEENFKSKHPFAYFTTQKDADDVCLVKNKYYDILDRGDEWVCCYSNPTLVREEEVNKLDYPIYENILDYYKEFPGYFKYVELRKLIEKQLEERGLTLDSGLGV